MTIPGRDKGVKEASWARGEKERKNLASLLNTNFACISCS